MKRILATGAFGSVLAAALPVAATAQEAGDTLRVCASTRDAPFSDRQLDGFENRIARIIADEAGLALDLVTVDKDAIFLVRDGIETGLCDVIVGVDAGDERLLTTEPYYKSGYAYVSRQDRGFDGSRWQDIDREGLTTFAYRYYGPAETILKYTGRYEYNLIYQASLIDFEDRRNRYTQVPAKRVVDEVAAGTADIGILFAPEAARYVRDSRTPLTMTLISNDIERSDGEIIPLQYAQSVGVSKDHPELLALIEAALKSGRDRIKAVLDAEGIPTVPLS
ncbi:methanol oxidation system protein MoxJ [Rhodovulum sulfidophilum]|uniref:Methanol oxidation system protein MoxJ n=1 Tax=Rhodovulum visakhapatnamense TaxID=364297 RepID=A0ABS1RFA4_9RHOB|nr:methanol oxidation system protein MoxJ [Rhodovulum visakhapatnamense]MBL3569762.1 methanol oxidation system protein MoxJ [Rhodovulum visakhapatnamense]MBL3577844.1 methanol oxidation system protein MoxJ [Rhodovulum visakhapatnamense]OLS42327.1 methanol oxidation system protein MoxJ [Rhodovulum sulfidophilum]